jgi:hypothetical protein
LLVKDNANDAKDRLVWKYLKATDALDIESNMGLPHRSNGAPILFCAWDETANTPSAVTGFVVESDAVDCGDKRCWKETGRSTEAGGATGLIYTRKGGGGDPTKGKAILIAAGVNLPTPGPLDASTFFDQDTQVTF